MKRWTLTVWLLVVALVPVRADVLSYVASDDPSFAWEPGDTGPGYVNLKLTSQTWQGIPWQHTITVFRPTTVKYPDLAVLLITGGSYRPGQQELVLGSILANTMGATMAVLWDIPNQPLYDGLREDALIAYTFVKALETKDETWPLLFPMTKSAVRAMDALQAYSEQAWGQKIERFVTTGASKRGWTTWFTGAVDPRVCAIMPMVYDNLNLNAQMQHQIETWGAYSPQIDDYTKLGLQEKLKTEEGRAFAALVDPFTYRERITMPKLIVNGTNDAYWTLDALNLYRDQLSGPVYQIYVPNAGHGIADIQRVLGAAAGFVNLVAAQAALPEYTWTHAAEDGQAVLRITAPAATKCDLWSARADRARFGEATWSATPMAKEGDVWIGRVPLPETGAVAVFGEASFEVAGRAMPLSTTIQIHVAGQ